MSTSFVGISSAKRALLTQQAKQLKGTLLVTLHKAQHLKHVSLTGELSDPYCTLTIGSQKYISTTARDGGIHPSWAQQFLFHLDGESDGILYVTVRDSSSGHDRVIGQLGVNLIQLLDTSDETDTQWRALAGEKALDVEQGFVCITAQFTGTGREQKAEGDVAVGKETPSESTTDVPAPAKKLDLPDGEHVIPELANGAPATGDAENGTTPAAVAEKEKAPTALDTASNGVQGLSINPASPSSAATSPAPIVISNPNPISPHPVPAPSNPSSAFFQSPNEAYPLPAAKPPAPGYHILEVAAVGARPQTGSVRPTTGALRPTTAAPAGEEEKTVSAEEEAVPELELGDEVLLTAFDNRHLQHILQLVPKVDSGRFLCAACAGEGFASAYQCTGGCSWTIHERCLQEADNTDEAALPDMRLDPRHSHPLTWFESVYEDGDYVCVGCGGGGSGNVWHCNACSYDLHPGCMR